MKFLKYVGGAAVALALALVLSVAAARTVKANDMVGLTGDSARAADSPAVVADVGMVYILYAQDPVFLQWMEVGRYDSPDKAVAAEAAWASAGYATYIDPPVGSDDD
jgi:hypothetical protein